MCFRKAARVVHLLQGLAKVQIVSHSRFAAKMEFHTSHLGHRGRIGPRYPDTIRPNDLLTDGDADTASPRKPLQEHAFTSP